MKRTLVYVSLALFCVAGLFAWQRVTPAPAAGSKLAGARAVAVTPAAAQVNAVYGSLP